MGDPTFMRMTNATDVLQRALDLIATDLPAWLELFTDDAVVEFPYAASLGRPGRLEGKKAIGDYFLSTPGTFTNLRFRDLRIISGADPDVAVAEVHGSATLMPMNASYEQDYVMILRTKGGKAVHYTEYWNPLNGREHFERGAK
jgi:ketosteroid isomerase-like protein